MWYQVCRVLVDEHVQELQLWCDIKCAVHFWNAALASSPHRIEALSGNRRSGVRWLIDAHEQQNLQDRCFHHHRTRNCALGWGLFFVTQITAACNSTGLFTKLIITFTRVLADQLLSNANPVWDWLTGPGVPAIDTGRFGKKIDHCSRESKVGVCLVCMSCLTALHAGNIHQQYSQHLY